jgi:hypothetical protein
MTSTKKTGGERVRNKPGGGFELVVFKANFNITVFQFYSAIITNVYEY